MPTPRQALRGFSGDDAIDATIDAASQSPRWFFTPLRRNNRESSLASSLGREDKLEPVAASSVGRADGFGGGEEFKGWRRNLIFRNGWSRSRLSQRAHNVIDSRNSTMRIRVCNRAIDHHPSRGTLSRMNFGMRTIDAVGKIDK